MFWLDTSPTQTPWRDEECAFVVGMTISLTFKNSNLEFQNKFNKAWFDYFENSKPWNYSQKKRYNEHNRRCIKKSVTLPNFTVNFISGNFFFGQICLSRHLESTESYQNHFIRQWCNDFSNRWLALLFRRRVLVHHIALHNERSAYNCCIFKSLILLRKMTWSCCVNWAMEDRTEGTIQVFAKPIRNDYEMRHLRYEHICTFIVLFINTGL